MKSRLTQVLPSAVTLLSLLLALDALRRLATPTPGAGQSAAWELVAALACDTLDGRLARRLGVSTRFGMELDSLCDAVAFGVAPALLAWREGLSAARPLWPGLAACGLYAACGLLRLARFNLHTPLKPGPYFQGLAIPFAAATVIALTFLTPRVHGGVPPLVWTAALAALGLLMMSSLPFPSFKARPNERWLRRYLGAGVAATLLIAWRLHASWAMLSALVIYMSTGPLLALWSAPPVILDPSEPEA